MNQETNPYRPPTANVQFAPEAAAATLEVAGKGRRFCTWALDYAGFVALSMVVGVVMALVLGPDAARYVSGGWSYVFGFAVMAGYYLFFEGLWGRTPGKMIAGTIVTDMDGNAPTFGTVVKRTLARFVPFEGLTFFGERGFHDKVSKTLVLRKR